MSSPRDRDPFDDRPGDGSGWQEPAHLGEGTGSGDATRPAGDDQPAEEPRDAAPWQPPGWDLPPATPDRVDRPSGPPSSPPPGDPVGPPPGDPATGSWPPAEQEAPPRRGGLFGSRRRAGEVAKVFAYQGDSVGAQGWALQQGWSVTDGTGPEDAALAELLRTAPVRPSKDHRPGGVMRGRWGSLELVAFDAVYASGRYLVPEWAITAVPLLRPVPGFRLSPARLWKHRTGGLLQIPTGNDAFDTRWTLLAGEDGPQIRRLAQDTDVQQLLLGTDDGDEFWSAGPDGGGSGGFVAAVRPDGHRPLLIEHHARLLTALVDALVF